MQAFHTSRLSEYVAAISEHGDFDHPGLIERFGSLELKYDTPVDRSLDPYSEAYFDQQVALYREIAGRELNQQEGELHDADIDALVAAPNPIGILDAGHIGDYVRTISTMFALASLQDRPRVLDLGAGHGLSSELFALTGCHVHAIDIDPVLGDVSRQRAAARGYSVERTNLNFDDIGTLADGHYDAAFFFQSLHHSLRPWRLIEDLAPKLVPGGVIAFAGEPIQDMWWPHWGLRLDPVSLFAARRSGWFESGFSHRFIAECFKRSGWTLTFFSGGLRGEIGVATADPVKRDAVLRKAVQLGLQVVEPDINPADERYLSHVGARTILHGRPGFTQRQSATGALLYGPYVTLDAGTYEVSMVIQHEPDARWSDRRARLTIEVDAAAAQQRIHRESFRPRDAREPKLVTRRFTLATARREVEIRAIVAGHARWSVSLPSLRRLA